MYICSFPILMYVGKYIIEQTIMLGEIYLDGQKLPMASPVVYTLFIETAANYGSVYSCFFSYLSNDGSSLMRLCHVLPGHSDASFAI